MATRREVIDRVVEGLGPEATARPMFGEYGLYLGGVFVGLVCDDRLYLKDTEAGAALLGTPQRAAPYPGAKLALVVDEEMWGTAALRSATAATAAALARSPRAAQPRRSRVKARPRG